MELNYVNPLLVESCLYIRGNSHITTL